MSQDITFIECKKIKFANGKKGLAQSVIDILYDSISKEGLHQAIGLRPDPDAPGHYVIVYGRHRFYVVAKMCKDEVIKSQVYEDMSPEEAKLATLTENACRTHAKPTDRLLVLRRWQEVYKRQYPQLEGKRAGATVRWANSTKAEAKQAAVDAEEASDAEECNDHNGHCISETDSLSDQTTVEVEVASEDAKPKAPKGKHKTFRDRVKSVTAVGDAQISRDLKINNGLNEEQIVCLDVVQCTKADMLKIIDASEDSDQRAEIVNQVASGMEVERAIAQVLGVTTTKESAGRIKEVGNVQKKSEPESDEEWFRRECGEFAGFLSDPDQFHADAVLYHQINEARHTFRKSIKKVIEKHQKDRKGKRWSWFFRSLHQIINVSHPNYWLMCGTCGGKGMDDLGVECPACKGACYKTTTEQYI